MGKVVFTMNVSLDGFVETADHNLDWSLVDDELHAWFNDHERAAGAFVYGRRLYEVMAAYWPTGESDPNGTDTTREYARIWNAKPKIVFSRTLDSVAWNSRLVRTDVVDEIPKLKAEFEAELHVAGPTLAAPLIERGLVDEYQLLVHPVVIGGGTPYFPDLRSRLPLRLLDTRQFGSGVVYLGYAPAS